MTVYAVVCWPRGHKELLRFRKYDNFQARAEFAAAARELRFQVRLFAPFQVDPAKKDCTLIPILSEHVAGSTIAPNVSAL